LEAATQELQRLNVGTTDLLGEFFLAMATPAPKTSWWMFGVDSNVAEPPAVVVLFYAILILVCLNLHNEITERFKGGNVL
jgi:hypothetical protein